MHHFLPTAFASVVCLRSNGRDVHILPWSTTRLRQQMSSLWAVIYSPLRVFLSGFSALKRNRKISLHRVYLEAT